MGKGIDLTRDAGAWVHADMLADLKDQLLIVFLKRLKEYGHSLYFSIEEVDDTDNDVVSFSMHPAMREFCFELRKKL